MRKPRPGRRSRRLFSDRGATERPWIEACFGSPPWRFSSPLLIYYRVGAMPLAALFGIAAGIALGLALTGRRLHQSLLDDALSGRDGKDAFLMTFAWRSFSFFIRVAGLRRRADRRAAPGVAGLPV